MKILIVDDAAILRMSLKLMLQKEGHEVVGEAENGLEAVEKYKALRPDLVTMDITMSDMDGIEALKQIIAFDPDACVVMVSAMAQQEMVKETIAAGAKGFIVKPFKQELVIKVVNKFKYLR